MAALLRMATVVVLMLLLAAAPVAASGEETLLAEYAGKEIALTDVAYYHCHDLAYPTILCFDSAEERDADAGIDSFANSADDEMGLLATNYVVWYEHANYLGGSYMTSSAWSDLEPIGWAYRISSFKSLNGQRPKWWSGASYSGTSWQWAAGAWVSYVGDGANDRFRSVKNVP
jgi:hypothetical protein